MAALPLSQQLEFGFIYGFATKTQARSLVEFGEANHFDSLWVGDHIAFPVPITDSLAQLACAAAYAETLTLGTCVFLLPLRHPTPVAKQIATIDALAEGRLIFGVGVGGEFANEYAACGVPVNERGARMTEGIEVLKKLWTGEKVSNEGRFYPFEDVRMLPAPHQAGGPPIWTGGRSEGALARCGRLADGWVSYVVTPEMYSAGLEKIAASAASAKRDIEQFGTGHLLFARIDNEYEAALDAATEHLSQRYAMDFRQAAKKYAALGTPADVAEKIQEFVNAGIRHIVLDMVGPNEDRMAQLEWFAKDVRPLLDSAI
ncbi:MAG: LLM class flavin-dependent oxidoreductase [Gammaproteobacteria bacterium]|nr:MAG: LLM class flavin-dependent oxidoreductase [Gammaproteobacteria bacterium]